jgi:trimeric autotransporter adhesin
MALLVRFTSHALMIMLPFFSIVAQAQPELVMDVHTTLDMSSVQSRSFIRASTQVFYVQNAALWVTKGTVASTKEIKKFTIIYQPTVNGSSIYFAADDGTGSGVELWKSNGTVSGTVKIKDIFSGPAPSDPRNITVVNATTVYFSANNGINGRELWKTNGTASGTVMVKDILKVTGSSNPSSICKVGTIVFFAANDGQNGTELWRSDGTVDGTLLVRNIHPGLKISSHPQLLTDVAGRLYFKANNGTSGFELYKSDGTTAGTQLLKDIRVGGNSGDVQNLININGTLFFTANDGIHGDELWKSNGTTSSTILVYDLNPGAGGSNNTSSERFPMGNFSNMNGTLFFTAGKGTTEEFIVRSDGTAQGTHRVADLKSVGYNPLQPCFTYLNGVVYYFNKITNVNGYDEYYLFRTDRAGKDLGALQQYRVPEAITENFIQDIVAFDSMLLTTNLTDYGWEILNQSLSGETQVLHTGHGPTSSSYPDPMVRAGNLIYFSSAVFWPDQNITFELWRTDGTANGTIRILDFIPDHYEMLAVGNKLFFTSASELYVTEGEGAAGLFYSYDPDPRFMPHGLTNVNGIVYFYNTAGELWKSDGTREGTVLVKSLNQILSITNVGGKAFVLNETSSGGLELWRTNTTGMLRVKVLRESEAVRSEYNPTAAIASNFYFVANDGIHGNELWRSDGTAVGTTLVRDFNTVDLLNNNGNEDDIRSFTILNNKLYVSCNEGNGWKLVMVTGKNSTTTITSLPPVNKSIIYHDKIYVFTDDPGDAKTFWVTDGLIGGATRLLGYNFDANIDEAFVEDNLYISSWFDGAMYQITDCGVYRVNISDVVVIEGLGADLLFNGLRGDVGYELFIYRNIADFTHSCPAVNQLALQEGRTAVAWPNPYAEDFTLRIDGPESGKAHVQVFDGRGFPVESYSNLSTNTDYSHLGSNWPKGNLILKINLLNSSQTIRLIRK